jgi:hypothetical protein
MKKAKTKRKVTRTTGQINRPEINPKDYIMGIPDSELEPEFRNRMRKHILDSLAGFRDVALNTTSLLGMWELEMTCDRNPPAVTADEVERTLRDIISRIPFGLRVGQIVTVVLNGRIKSRFFLSG